MPLTFSELGYELSDSVAKTVANTCDIITTNAHPLTSDDIYNLLIECR